MTTIIYRRGYGRRLARAAAFGLLALAAMLLQTTEAHAQWTTSGTSTSTTNTVGVGTAAPEQSFHVNGSSEILSTGTGSGFKFRDRSSASATDDWVWYSQGNVARFWRAGPGDLFGVTTTGKFGVGTITPGKKFEVLAADGDAARLYRNAADIGWGVNITFALNNSNAVRTDYAGVHGLVGSPTPGAEGGSLVFSTATGGGLTEKMRLDAAGNFGVGTTSPLARLDVFGAANVWSGGRYAVNQGFMPAGSLTVGNIGANFGGGSNGWNTNTAALMLEAQDNTEIAVHDAGTRLASFMYYEGAGANRLTIGRDMGFGGIGTVSINGNVGVGTNAPAAKLHVAGDIRVDGNINAKYQDVAEWVPSTQKLSAGTVVVLDGERRNHVLASTTSYDTAVAGVISAQPGISLGEAGEGRVLVATTGRVKVKVDASRAPIKIGDLIVTSDVPGVAMRSEPLRIGGRQFHAPGTIVGKALEPLAGGTGEILVLLSLQ